MSDTVHVIYTFGGFIITAILIFLAVKFIKDQKKKDFILKLSAIVTVILHFSILYVEYFQNGGSAQITLTYLMPAYPCHIAMWLLVIVAFMRDKKSTAFKTLSEITFYLGIIGGVFGIVLNEIYISNPNLADWGVLKGMLSHSTMLYGCIYLLAGGYVKLGVKNMSSVLIGLLLLVADGAIVIGVHYLFGVEPPNSMYLLESPMASLPWLNTWMLGISAFLVIFAFNLVYEHLALNKEERWITSVSKKVDEYKHAHNKR